MAYLGLLGLGATEFALIALAYVLLFGVDRTPELARRVGRAQARFSRWKAEFDREVEAARTDAQQAFELEREEHIRNQDPRYVEETRLRDAADALGVETEGRSEDEIREAIREAVGDEGSG